MCSDLEPHRTKLIDDGKSPNPRYRGFLHGSVTIVREEGLRGIYRGLFPVVSNFRIRLHNVLIEIVRSR